MDIKLETSPHGVILCVKAQPGARKNEIRGLLDGALKVSCTQIAEHGKANRAIGDILAKVLKLRKSQIELLSGETDSRKRFLLKDVTENEIREKIIALNN